MTDSVSELGERLATAAEELVARLNKVLGAEFYRFDFKDESVSIERAIYEFRKRAARTETEKAPQVAPGALEGDR